MSKPALAAARLSAKGSRASTAYGHDGDSRPRQGAVAGSVVSVNAPARARFPTLLVRVQLVRGGVAVIRDESEELIEETRALRAEASLARRRAADLRRSAATLRRGPSSR